jgi:hypothetical protein
MLRARSGAYGPHGWALGSKWIDARHACVKTCGWANPSGWLATRPDKAFDLGAAARLWARPLGSPHGR